MKDNRVWGSSRREGDGVMILKCAICRERFYAEPCDITTFTERGQWTHLFNKATALCNDCKEAHPKMVVEIDMGPGSVSPYDP